MLGKTVATSVGLTVNPPHGQQEGRDDWHYVTNASVMQCCGAKADILRLLQNSGAGAGAAFFNAAPAGSFRKAKKKSLPFVIAMKSVQFI